MKKYLGEIILLFVAMLFGTSYIFQTVASFTIGPLYFGLIRYLISGLLLTPFLFIKDKTSLKDLFKVGLIMGVLLFVASICQQIAAGKTESGKLGFISSLYIVLVPLINKLFFKKKVPIGVNIAVVIAVFGLGLLCNFASFSVNPYDLIVLGTALAYALEIIYVDKNTGEMNPCKFMCASTLGAFFVYLLFTPWFETLSISSIKLSIIPILYLGIFAGAIGFSLQAIGQNIVEDTTASLIMSFESVISVVMGVIFLNEVFTIKELMGCALMFVAIIICVKSKD